MIEIALKKVSLNNNAKTPARAMSALLLRLTGSILYPHLWFPSTGGRIVWEQISHLNSGYLHLFRWYNVLSTILGAPLGSRTDRAAAPSLPTRIERRPGSWAFRRARRDSRARKA